MAETKKSTRDAKQTKRAPESGDDGAKTASENATSGSEDANGGESLAGRADQLGAILAKGLDLAEAGLSLGLTVIQRVGTATQESIFERTPGAGAAPSGGPTQNEGAGEPGFEQGTPEGAEAPEAPGFCIMNRVPIWPGGSVSISFSINNDSVAAEKRVSLRVDGFTGEMGEVRLESDGFAVKPQRKTIAPMDFEKFVLKGEIPAATPQDVYHGSIVVSSTDEFTIPVRLVVMSP